MTDNHDSAPCEAAESVLRDSVVARPRRGQRASLRRQTVINAETGQALDEKLAKDLTLAAQRRLSVRRTVDGLDDPERGHLAFLFGLDR